MLFPGPYTTYVVSLPSSDYCIICLMSNAVVSPLLRCKKWIENCNRIDLDDKTPDELYRQHRLCAKHFEDSVMETTVSEIILNINIKLL